MGVVGVTQLGAVPSMGVREGLASMSEPCLSPGLGWLSGEGLLGAWASRGSDLDGDGGHEEMSLLLSGRLPWQGWASGQECTPAGAPSVTPAGRGADTGFIQSTGSLWPCSLL